MRKYPYLLAAVAIAALALPVVGQVSTRTVVEQIPQPRAGPAVPQQVPAAQSSRSAEPALRGDVLGAATELPPKSIEICIQAALRGVSSVGLDCDLILEQTRTNAPRPSAESALVGGRGEQVEAPNARLENGASRLPSADAVARQLATGEVQGTGNAAGILARGAPPPGGPR
jgi:hypothetical protein